MFRFSPLGVFNAVCVDLQQILATLWKRYARNRAAFEFLCTCGALL